MKDPIRPAPIAVTARNAEAVVGVSWRWLREHAAVLGVEICQVEGKGFILAEPLREALQKFGPVKAEPELELPADPAQHVRDALGKVRRIA